MFRNEQNDGFRKQLIPVGIFMTQDTQTLIDSEQTVNYRYCTCAICSGVAASDLSTAPMAGTTPSYEIDMSWIGLGQREKLAFLQSNQAQLDSKTKQSNPSNITYSFFNNASEANGLYSQNRIEQGASFKFTQIPANARLNFHEGIKFLEKIVNLKFTEVAAGQGQIRIGSHNTTVGGYASYPSESPQNLWVDDSLVASNIFDLTLSGYPVLWHELGHALGLQHPFYYGSDGKEGGNISKFIDIDLLSQMSYVDFNRSRPYFFSPLDYVTLVTKYGPTTSSVPIQYNILINSWFLETQQKSSLLSVNVPLRYDSGISSIYWIVGSASNDELNAEQLASIFLDAKGGYLSQSRFGASFIPTGTAYHLEEKMDIKVNWSSSVNSLSGVFVMPADGVNFHPIETVKLGSGNDEIVLGDYFKHIFSGAGNDRFNGFEGGVSIDGGIGNDSLSIDDKSISYQISGNKIRKTASSESPISEMQFLSVESIIFSDRKLTISFDAKGNPGQIYRVYKAVFNRDPMTNDMKGLGYWIKQTDNGMQLQEVAARFIDSNEFRALYGTNPTNSEYLTKVYSNVLGRMPDKAGFDWWLSEMNTNPTKTKVKVLTDFSESPENQQGVASLIGNGIVFEPWTV